MILYIVLKENARLYLFGYFRAGPISLSSSMQMENKKQQTSIWQGQTLRADTGACPYTVMNSDEE
jgi:hypothetical protein